VRKGLIHFPLGYRLAGNTELFRKLFLRDPVDDAQMRDLFTYGHDSSRCLSRPPAKKQCSDVKSCIRSCAGSAFHGFLRNITYYCALLAVYSFYRIYDTTPALANQAIFNGMFVNHRLQLHE